MRYKWLMSRRIPVDCPLSYPFLRSKRRLGIFRVKSTPQRGRALFTLHTPQISLSKVYTPNVRVPSILIPSQYLYPNNLIQTLQGESAFRQRALCQPRLGIRSS